MDRGRLALVVPAGLVVLTAFVLLAVAFDRPPQIRGPAPYPPEWQWSLRGEPTSGRFALPVLAAAGLLGLLVLSASGRARARPRRSARAILAAATLGGFALSVGLLGLEPAGAAATLAARTMSVSWTSYYTVALSPDAADPLDFLDRHAVLLPHLPKHAATHPPGPVLYYRALVAIVGSSPRQTAALVGALLLTLLGVATAWPVAAIAAHLSGDDLAGARTGVLWTLLPGPVLFIPQFDQALALPVAGTAALLLAAAAEPRAPARLARSVGAGAAAGIALFVSYGAVAFLAVTALAVLAVTGLSRRALTVGVLAAAVSVALIASTTLLGHDPIAAARMALAIHRETYTRPRSYALWLPFNLLDLSLFLGPPVAVLFALRVVNSPLARTVAAGLPVLLLSGATRGEVGRLWIPLMPLLLVGAVARPAGADGDAAPSLREALLLGALLAAVDLVLRTRWLL